MNIFTTIAICCYGVDTQVSWGSRRPSYYCKRHSKTQRGLKRSSGEQSPCVKPYTTSLWISPRLGRPQQMPWTRSVQPGKKTWTTPVSSIPPTASGLVGRKRLPSIACYGGSPTRPSSYLPRTSLAGSNNAAAVIGCSWIAAGITCADGARWISAATAPKCGAATNARKRKNPLVLKFLPTALPVRLF